MTTAVATADASVLPVASAPLAGGMLALLTVDLAPGTFMEVLDTSIANVAVPTISGSLGVATSEGTWVI
jgi:DHA2 family multidrug resistance protein